MTLGTAAPVADIGGHIAHAHVANLKVVAGRLVRARSPAAQDVRDARIGTVGKVRAVRVIHGRDVGQHRRPNIVVVICRDAHELRAFDQKSRMARIGDADLVGIERQPERSRHQARRMRRHQSGAILPHFRLRRRVEFAPLPCHPSTGWQRQSAPSAPVAEILAKAATR